MAKRKKPAIDYEPIDQSHEAIARRIKRKKLVTKAFGVYNFTPLVSRMLAGVFVELSEGDEKRRMEVRNLIDRVLVGRNG